MTETTVYESILAVDVGAIHTRAYLFEMVEDKFRYIAQGSSRTTAGAPMLDIMPGVLEAVRELESITERKFIDPAERLLIAKTMEGNGVDGLAATISAGPDVKVICAGLLANLSLESAEHLAVTSDARVCDYISASDKRKPDAQVDSFLKILPDIVILAGGTELGASRSVQTVLETIQVASSLLPRDKRPEILFAGNSALAERVKNSVGTLAPVTFTSNIRPSPESESLDPAQGIFAEMAARVKYRQVTGAINLNQMTGNKMMLTSASFGRMIRFLGKAYTSRSGVLGIDLGSTHTTLATGKNNRLSMLRQRWAGDFDTLAAYRGTPRELQQWIRLVVTDEQVKDYLLNKSAYPAGIPSTDEELAIEYALTSFRLRQALLSASKSYPHLNLVQGAGLNFGFEPVIVSGTMMTGAPSAEHCLMMILDGLQPAGITTVVLDQNNILPVLGACGQLSPAMPVDVLNSGVMQNLCTVISPVSRGKLGSTLLRARLTLATTEEIQMEIRQGDFLAIPLEYGQTAKLQLETEPHTDLGLRRSGKGISLRVSGGSLGLVFDARGRPVRIPDDADERREKLKSWFSALSA